MATTSIFAGTGPDQVGAANGTNLFDGYIISGHVIDGTTRVSYFDARPLDPGSVLFTDAEGVTWTGSGSASIVADITADVTTRKAIARKSNIAEYDNGGPEDPITGVGVIGRGEGDDMQTLYLTNASSTTPLWESRLSLKHEDNTTILTDRGNAVLKGDFVDPYIIKIDPTLKPQLGDVAVGDTVRLVIKDRFTEIDETRKVARIRVTLSREQTEQITLEVI